MKISNNKNKLYKNIKSQGLSLNTIIIAAIVLIVLIVLWAIFTGRMGVFTKGVISEEAKSRMEAERLAAEAKGYGCIPKKYCSEIIGDDDYCKGIGCSGSKDNKCKGTIPEKCIEKKTKEECEGEDVCKWITK